MPHYKHYLPDKVVKTSVTNVDIGSGLWCVASGLRTDFSIMLRDS